MTRINDYFRDHWTVELDNEDIVVINFEENKINVNGLILPVSCRVWSKLTLFERAVYMVACAIEKYNLELSTYDVLVKTFDTLINESAKEAVNIYKYELQDKLTDLLQEMGYNCEVY